MLNSLHTSASSGRILRMSKRKFQCSMAPSLDRLGMATNNPSSAYKPMHEYRILRVSNSPHLCELCTTLSVAEQLIPLCMVSSFAKRLACLEHHQVKLSTLSRSSNSAIPTFVRSKFFQACLFSWCLLREGLAIPLNANLRCPLLRATPFPYISMPVFPQTVARVLTVLNAAPLGPPRLHAKCFYECLSRSDTI